VFSSARCDSVMVRETLSPAHIQHYDTSGFQEGSPQAIENKRKINPVRT
jgi:hypothetical protein